MNKRGFTLTELITVIAIIGLILLITIPVYTGVMNNNKEEKYKLYVETVEKAVLTYADIENVNNGNVTIDYLVKEKYLAKNDDIDQNLKISFAKGDNGIKITAPLLDNEFYLKFGNIECTKIQCQSNP